MTWDDLVVAAELLRRLWPPTFAFVCCLIAFCLLRMASKSNGGGRLKSAGMFTGLDIVGLVAAVTVKDDDEDGMRSVVVDALDEGRRAAAVPATFMDWRAPRWESGPLCAQQWEELRRARVACSGCMCGRRGRSSGADVEEE